MSTLVLERRGSAEIRQLPRAEAASAPAETQLVEREVELDALAAFVGRLDTGRGGVVVLEAGAGLGKSALVEHAARVSAAAGHEVRRAAPGPLEQEFSLGVVRTLLERPLRESAEADPGDCRAELLEGPAAMAGALLLDGRVPGDDATVMLAHSVLWLCARLAERRPLALFVDDAQWADRRSLQVMSYLARRIDDMPLLIAVAARTHGPAASADRLGELGTVGSAAILHPGPLSPSGAVRLIRRLAPDTPIQVCCESHRAAAGNPWLLGELGRQIAEHGRVISQHASRLAGPGAGVGKACGEEGQQVTAYGRTSVRRRMAELQPPARALAAALAVTGPGASAQVLAAVAGIEGMALNRGLDALRAAGLLSADEDRFAHALIAVAIRDDLPPTERECLHREAALALIASGASADEVAGHLLRCRPQGDPAATAALRRAASAATNQGAPQIAAAYLERALQERAPDEDRAQMLAQLAGVAFDAGLPDSPRWLQEALREVRDTATRADLLTRLAALGIGGNAHPLARQALEQLDADEAEQGVRIATEAAALDVLLTIPGRSAERARRAGAVRITSAGDPLLKRVIVAHRAWAATELGSSDAGACVALALQALDGDLLLRAAGTRPAYHLCIRVLMMTDRVDQAHVALAALREHALACGSLRLQAAAAWQASELALRTGQMADAERQARLAVDIVEGDVNVFTAGAVAVLVAALAERGEFEHARHLLRARGPEGIGATMPWRTAVRHAQACLWLYEGDFERAYADACEAGAERERQGRPNPAMTPWRSTAALALSHLGRRAEAAQLADAELVRAERFGAPVPIARALHARAVAEAEDTARLALCERGLAVLAGKLAVLESTRLRLELGATLAYMGRRIEAREALRPALADADAMGASLLAQRARRELVATGLRPRRAALDGAAALTPRQRQICEQAAAGMSNRAIAHALFLSIKTVETHLAAGYRKLGVNSRQDLAAELGR